MVGGSLRIRSTAYSEPGPGGHPQSRVWSEGTAFGVGHKSCTTVLHLLAVWPQATFK